MVNWFRNTEIAYWITSFVGGLGFALFGIFGQKPWLILLALVWIFVMAIVFSVVAQKKYNKIVSLMNDECRCNDYVEQTNAILSRCKNKKNRNLLLINLSAGYLNLGNTEFARQVFGCLEPFADTPRGAYEKAVYLNNLFLYHLLLKDIENAGLVLAEFKKTIDGGKIPKLHQDRLFDCYADRVMDLRMEQGDFDGAEAYFALAIEKKRCRMATVSAKYNLAKCYLHAGKTEQAKQAFLFVAENGGDSLDAAAAKKKLAELT